jgi:acyl-CoA reductase-like NAD-dependent aldehyde dehydrogenase
MLAAIRQAQAAWAAVPLAQRLAVLRRFRGELAREALSLARASASARGRSLAEVLTAEVLPLADACRFLERAAARALRPRRLGRRGRPLWLNGVHSEIRREPLGVVLVIGPGNYPLFLPAVQCLQALTAGNAVLLKPAPGGTAAARAWARLLAAASLPSGLLVLLDEDPREASQAIEAGVDKLVLTGSADTGRVVLEQLAPQLTPATLELSGMDAAVICAEADLRLAAGAIVFGLSLNAGATCIAPRRLFVHERVAAPFREALREAARQRPPPEAPLTSPRGLVAALTAELARTPPWIGTGDAAGGLRPPLVCEVPEDSSLWQQEWFAGVALVARVRDDAEAVQRARASPYALGASVFSRDTAAARRLAAQLPAGVVTINDLIVPTADPRLPFGGRGRSGFGVTRGLEGLLELTVPKVVSVRQGRWRPHYEPERPGATELFTAYLRLVHGRGMRARWQAGCDLVRRVWRTSRATGQAGADAPGLASAASTGEPLPPRTP